jgi:hypothetical protein
LTFGCFLKPEDGSGSRRARFDIAVGEVEELTACAIDVEYVVSVEVGENGKIEFFEEANVGLEHAFGTVVGEVHGIDGCIECFRQGGVKQFIVVRHGVGPIEKREAHN